MRHSLIGFLYTRIKKARKDFIDSDRKLPVREFNVSFGLWPKRASYQFLLLGHFVCFPPELGPVIDPTLENPLLCGSHVKGTLSIFHIFDFWAWPPGSLVVLPNEGSKNYFAASGKRFTRWKSNSNVNSNWISSILIISFWFFFFTKFFGLYFY